MKRKFFLFLALVAVSVSLSGVASAHCGKCGMDGDHKDGASCTMSADKMAEGKKECSVKDGDKQCKKHCKKACCYKAKTNFSVKKR